MYTTDENYTGTESYDVDFGINDQKGRRIGACVRLFEMDLVEIPEEKLHSWRYGIFAMPPGHYLCVRTQATRNGESYGATQEPRYFHTEEEQEAAVARYLSDAKKRAARRK